MKVSELKKMPAGTLFCYTRVTRNQVFRVKARNPFTIEPLFGGEPFLISKDDNEHIYKTLSVEEINTAMGKLMSTPEYMTL